MANNYDNDVIEIGDDGVFEIPVVKPLKKVDSVILNRNIASQNQAKLPLNILKTIPQGEYRAWKCSNNTLLIIVHFDVDISAKSVRMNSEFLLIETNTDEVIKIPFVHKVEPNKSMQLKIYQNYLAITVALHL